MTCYVNFVENLFNIQDSYHISINWKNPIGNDYDAIKLKKLGDTRLI